MPEYPLFVYGTLMEASIQHEVLGRHCRHRPATLQGCRVHYGAWPYVLAAAGCNVSGMILTDLTDDDLVKLDAYEQFVPAPHLVDGDIYTRQLVKVTSDDGATMQVWVYFPLLEKWRPEWLEQKN